MDRLRPAPAARLAGWLGNVDVGVDGAFGVQAHLHGPGLALISGKCADIGQFSVPQPRALSSRAPYFGDGLAGCERMP